MQATVTPTDHPAVGSGASTARLVLAGVVANLAVGTLFGWSLVAEDAAADLGMSRAAAASVFATAIVVFAAVLLGVGPALRRVGPRRLLQAAAALGGGGLLLAASADRPPLLWAGVALLFGTANGLAYGVSVGLAARVRVSRRGTATGVIVAAYAAGPVVLGLGAPTLLRAFGWRPGLAGLAVVVTGLLAAAAQLAPRARTAPVVRGTAIPRVPHRPVVLLWLVFAGGTAPALLLFAHAVPVAAARQLSPQAAGLAVSALAVGNLTGRLGAGWWSDRVGRPPALAAALTTAAVSIAVLAGSTTTPVVLAAFLGAGTAYGAVSSLVPAATADRVDPGAFSAAYARVFTGWGLAGLLAPLAGGPLLRLDADHPALLAVAAAPLLPAAVAVLLLGERATRGG